MSQPTIDAGKVVSIHYSLHLGDGQVVDRSGEGDPLEYLHGKENIVPGLESRLEGRQVGEKLAAVVPPEEAYGERSEEGLHEVPRSALPPGAEVEVGQQLAVEDPSGNVLPVFVAEVREDELVLDLNHPLAGRTLHFEVEVVGVRPATDEELQHGHPHGEDGDHDH